MGAFNWQAIVSGVGGQGVLFVTRVLANASRTLTKNILISEVHGMAQRGGSVVSHLKAGGFDSPLVAAGKAGLLFSLDAGEAVRNIPFLAPEAVLVVNSPDMGFLSAKGRKALERHNIKAFAFDASTAARQMGAPKAANVVLLGAAAAGGALPFNEKQTLKVLEQMSKGPRLAANRKLFARGAKAAG